MKNIIEDREIKSLVHFTRCDNLQNIFSYGLLPRSEILERKISSVFNDEYRNDGYLNAICTSITFPNYRMFYKVRQLNPGIKWAVIGIDASILYEKECAFCVDNAASMNETRLRLDGKKGVEVFNRLFDEYPGQESRKTLGIDKNMTTNPQSEVLVFGLIEVEKIQGVAFKNEGDKNEFEQYIPKELKILVGDYYFRARDDYDYWR